MKRHFSRWLVVMTTTLTVVPVTWIGSAYAMQLSLTRKPILVVAPHIVRAAKTESFLARLSESVARNRATLLWSVYPASVRGQVILDASPGNDPILTGGGW